MAAPVAPHFAIATVIRTRRRSAGALVCRKSTCLTCCPESLQPAPSIPPSAKTPATCLILAFITMLMHVLSLHGHSHPTKFLIFPQLVNLSHHAPSQRMKEKSCRHKYEIGPEHPGNSHQDKTQDDSYTTATTVTEARRKGSLGVPRAYKSAEPCHGRVVLRAESQPLRRPFTSYLHSREWGLTGCFPLRSSAE